MINTSTTEWRAVERFALKRIEDLKEDLCSYHIDEGKTQVKRGQILAFRELLDLPDNLYKTELRK